MIRFGVDGCEHRWVYRTNGWEEECIPAVCLDCGAFGCGCDTKYNLHNKIVREDFMSAGVDGNANISGKWKNPYVEV